MSPCTAIALSGGIDSLVSAAILKEQGHRVIGFHFLTGYEAHPSESVAGAALSFDALTAHARRSMDLLADQLGIPIYIINLQEEFQSVVVDYFTRTYARGETPNPCLVCNPSIKFDILFSQAVRYGATRIATGHYARVATAGSGRKRLLRGFDGRKEQSYFLSRLTQEQLAAAVLPLGVMTKEQTRRLARRKGLIPATAQESQDVCFIRSSKYADFLASQPGFTVRAGPIEDTGGRLIGHHKGLHHFTIGQRRGINCPAAEPYYVIRIDPAANRLIVGNKEALFTRDCRVRQINWIAPRPARPIKVETRVRYRHKAVPATLIPIAGDRAEVIFEAPESAVTPGQGAVFYQGDEVLGGGWIE